MVDCDYCEDVFSDEEAYLRHLRAEHEGELGAIDRRRVRGVGGDDDGRFSGGVVLGVMGLVVVGVVVYVSFFLGGGGGSPGEPYAVGSVHTHGQIDVTIDGQRVDFSQDEYQLQADAFHFEGGDGQKWHGHAKGVTLKWAMATLDIGVTADTVTFQGTTYRDSDSGTTVTVQVNGQSVAPSEYVLKDGDDVRIVVKTS